jgi:hypothetical protein
MTDIDLDRAVQERARGAIVGLAIGDALGAPVEFKDRDSFPEVRAVLAALRNDYNAVRPLSKLGGRTHCNHQAFNRRTLSLTGNELGGARQSLYNLCACSNNTCLTFEVIVG